MSDLAISTSTVSNLGASDFTSEGLSERPASIAATPPAPTATVKTMTRAAFIRPHSPDEAAISGRVSPGRECGRLHRISAAKGQGMVKERYPNRVNVLLAALTLRLHRPQAGIQPVFG